jgi:hypothetical protein
VQQARTTIIYVAGTIPYHHYCPMLSGKLNTHIKYLTKLALLMNASVFTKLGKQAPDRKTLYSL